MRPNVHFNPSDTAAYMADRSTIRLILALAACENKYLDHIDIDSAYLHEPYDDPTPLYVRQPERFDGSFKHPKKYGRLRLNLYGTTTAGHRFSTALCDFLTKHGYQQSSFDQCLFLKQSKHGPILVAVSMDDFLICSPRSTDTNEFKNLLATKYRIKHLGRPTKYLGWDISQSDKGGLIISQGQYITHILEKHGMHNSNARTAPACHRQTNHSDTSSKLSIEDTTAFQSLVGDLRYLADCTRPDIAHIAAELARSMQSPTKAQMQRAKGVLRYLSGTKRTWSALQQTQTSIP